MRKFDAIHEFVLDKQLSHVLAVEIKRAGHGAVHSPYILDLLVVPEAFSNIYLNTDSWDFANYFTEYQT